MRACYWSSSGACAGLALTDSLGRRYLRARSFGAQANLALAQCWCSRRCGARAQFDAGAAWVLTQKFCTGSISLITRIWAMDDVARARLELVQICARTQS